MMVRDVHGSVDDLVVVRPQGLYCPPGDFYIDPWRPVDRAVITHAHADHARTGHGHVLAAQRGDTVLRARLGNIPLQTLAYGEAVDHFGVRLSLHPAGHVLGSSQVRLEHGGRVWVVSGDYFVSGAADINPTCEAFEAVRCDVFVTESTFGLPIYRWRPHAEVFADINAWWQSNASAGRTSILTGYSLGKAQRLLAGVDASVGAIFVHSAVDRINHAYRDKHVPLPMTQLLDTSAKQALQGALVVAPPALQGSRWRTQLGQQASEAFASGWMQVRGMRRRSGVDRGFVLSDHADWPGLLHAIEATQAARVIVTHGQAAALVSWLQARGIDAGSFKTEYGDEALDSGAAVGVEDAATATAVKRPA
jgi:putative mRNA 3-end processing factor